MSVFRLGDQDPDGNFPLLCSPPVTVCVTFISEVYIQLFLSQSLEDLYVDSRKTCVQNDTQLRSLALIDSSSVFFIHKYCAVKLGKAKCNIIGTSVGWELTVS